MNDFCFVLHLSMETLLLGNISRQAASTVEDRVTQIGERVCAPEGDEEATVSRRSDPKKRIVMLTAFLACLSFVLVFANAIMTFIYNIVREDAFWSRLRDLMDVKNVSTLTLTKINE